MRSYLRGWEPAVVVAYSTAAVALAAQWTAAKISLGAVPPLEHGYGDIGGWSAVSWMALAILGILSTVVAFLIFFWAVRRFGASRGALISYLAPVAGLLMTFVVLGERPFPVQLVGAIVILAGVRLATRKPLAVAPSRTPLPA